MLSLVLFDLKSATTPGQSGSGSDGNKGALIISQSPCITGASPSDCLMSYPGHSLGESYPSAEMQSLYSATPADWAYMYPEKGDYIVFVYNTNPLLLGWKIWINSDSSRQIISVIQKLMSQAMLCKFEAFTVVCTCRFTLHGSKLNKCLICLSPNSNTKNKDYASHNNSKRGNLIVILIFCQ